MDWGVFGLVVAASACGVLIEVNLFIVNDVLPERPERSSHQLNRRRICSHIALLLAELTGLSMMSFFAFPDQVETAVALFSAGFLICVSVSVSIQYAIELGRDRQQAENQRDFIYMIAHELKTPMSVVMLHGEKVLEEKTAQGKDRRAANMIEEIELMNKRLIELLNASKLERGLHELHIEPVSLRALALDVVEGYEFPMEEKRLRVVVLGEDLQVNADGYLIKYAVSNLLSNAIKFSQQGGSIELRLEERRGGVVVSVHNTGSRVPEHMRRKVWDPFVKEERGDNAQKGTGLGLSIVRSVARLHGGECGLENTREGVRVWFSVMKGLASP